MKAAAAVLGASLLFFLGVLTGVGRRESVPPPTAIPLGVVNRAAPADGATPSSPAPGRPKSTTTRPASTNPTSTADPSLPAGSPDSSGSGAGTADTTGPTVTATTGPSTTSTTGPRPVEQVDNQVDCTSTGKRGKGNREPCPSTTATGDEPGGGRQP